MRQFEVVVCVSEALSPTPTVIAIRLMLEFIFLDSIVVLIYWIVHTYCYKPITSAFCDIHFESDPHLQYKNMPSERDIL